MIDFLRPRATPGVEVVQETATGGRSRSVTQQVSSTVRPDAYEPRLLVPIDLPTNEGLIQVVERVRRIFDLGADPLQIDTLFVQRFQVTESGRSGPV